MNDLTEGGFLLKSPKPKCKDNDCENEAIDPSVNMSKVIEGYALATVNKMTYVKDKDSGLCFGVVATRKTFRTGQSGMGVVCVPCESVRHRLVNP